MLKQQGIATDVEAAALGLGGKVAGAGIVATGGALIGASAAGIELGLPTFVAGLATTLVVLAIKRGGLVAVMKDVSWSVLPLVAGLFVLVEALEKSGVLTMIADQLRAYAQADPAGTAWGSGIIVAVGSNLVNNLPAGLLAGAAVHAAAVSKTIAGAILIGVDLGPNLSVTGSLATILWLTAIRREGEDVSAWRFLKLGLVVMPPALVARARRTAPGLKAFPKPSIAGSEIPVERRPALPLHPRRRRPAGARQLHERAVARPAGEPLARSHRVLRADRVRVHDVVRHHADAAPDASRPSARCRGTRRSAASRARWRCSAASPSSTRSAPGRSTA